MNKPGKCKHFNGLQNRCCAAGVSYGDLAGNEPGIVNRLPCWRIDLDGQPLDTSTRVVCDKYLEPTSDELAAELAERKASMDRLNTVMAGIAGLRKEYRGVGYAGIIECPVCKGPLHLTIARSNGHAHGCCETPHCAQWME